MISLYEINSALQRRIKNALFKSDIDLPDSARGVIFPKGVPAIQTTSATEVWCETESGAGAAHAADEMSETTPGEGDLSVETVEMQEQQSEGNLAHAQETLLKN